MGARIVSLCVLLLVISIGASCGSKPPQPPSIDPSLQAAAGSSLQAYAERVSVPYRNPSYTVSASDGVFATVSIEAEFRETPQAPWAKSQLSTACKRIGKVWQCEDASAIAATSTPPGMDKVAVKVATATATAPVARSTTDRQGQTPASVSAGPTPELDEVREETPLPTLVSPTPPLMPVESETPAALVAQVQTLHYVHLSGTYQQWMENAEPIEPCVSSREYGYSKLGVPAIHDNLICPWLDHPFDTYNSSMSSCTSSGDMICRGSTPPVSISEQLTGIVRGEAEGGYTLRSHQRSSDSYEGMPCTSFTREQTLTNEIGDIVSRDTVCFDRSSNLPFRWTRYSETRKAGIKTFSETFDWTAIDAAGARTLDVPNAARVGVFLVSKEQTGSGNGWANLDLQLATVNNDGVWHSAGWSGEFAVSTREGYMYRGSIGYLGDSNLYLPPGFGARGSASCNGDTSYFGLDVKVAANSTPSSMDVRERELWSFPTDGERSTDFAWWNVLFIERLPVSFPIAVEMPGLSIAGQDQSANLADQAEVAINEIDVTDDRTLVQFQLRNLRGGYEFNEYMTTYVIGSDGLMYRGCGSDTGGRMNVGPGQEATFGSTFPIPSSVTKRYLVVTIGQRPATAGVVFRLE